MKQLFLFLLAFVFSFGTAQAEEFQIYSPVYGLWRINDVASDFFKGSVHITPLKVERREDAAEKLLISDAKKHGFLCSGLAWDNDELDCTVVTTTKINIIPEDLVSEAVVKMEKSTDFILRLDVDGNTLKIMARRTVCASGDDCPFEELSILTREEFENPRFYEELRPISSMSWETHLTPTKKLTRNIEGYEIEEDCWMYENRAATVSLICIMKEHMPYGPARYFYIYKIVPCNPDPRISKTCTCQTKVKERMFDSDDRVRQPVEVFAPDRIADISTFCLP